MRYAILFLLTLTGCTSATMVNRPGGPGSQYAPIGESAHTGVVKYLDAGSSGRIQARRADAYRQMSEACNSKYKIAGEETEPGTSPGEHRPYRLITFQCEP